MIYEYICERCNKLQERYTTDYNQKTIACNNPKCNGKAIRIISGKQMFKGESDWNNYKIKDVPYE